MGLNNVPRLPAPSSEDFFRDYVLPARPVILTGLFNRHPIHLVDTSERARRAFGDVELEIQPNYMNFLTGGESTGPRLLRLAEYMDHVLAASTSRDLCVEYATPVRLLTLFPKPSYCKLRDEHDVVSATFVANRDNFNHLHFDDDQRDVLLYQVFGIKRFVIISPAQGRKLDAFLVFDRRTAAALADIPARDANGRVFLEDFPSEESRDAFLQYVKASETVLYPGETLFIPALHWHYVEYLDLSMSLTYRLGRNRYNRLLSQVFPRPTIFVQSVGAKLVNDVETKAHYGPLIETLYRACQRVVTDGREPDPALHRLICRIFEEMYGDSVAGIAVSRELYRLALRAQVGSHR